LTVVLIIESGTFDGEYAGKSGLVYKFHAYYRLIEATRGDWSAIVTSEGAGRLSIGGDGRRREGNTHQIAYQALVT
jgi:hypothetical protein